MLLTSIPAWAEWVEHGSYTNAGIFSYEDPATVRRVGNYVSFVELHDYTNPTSAALGYKSIKRHAEIDCAGERNRSLSETTYSLNMGKGTQMASNPDPGKWYTAHETKKSSAQFDRYCNKGKPR